MARFAKLRDLLGRLRIPYTVFISVLCLLTIAWWVRSYTYHDTGFVWIPPSEHIQFSSGDARMVVWFELDPISYWFSWNAREITTHVRYGADNRIPHFDLAFWPRFARLYIAHWVIAVATVLLAILPWIPRRFSFRTLLGATTIACLVTGVIMWVDRTF